MSGLWFPFSNLWNIATQPGARVEDWTHEFGDALLAGAGSIIEEQTAATHMALPIKPPVLSALGLSLEMTCWPIRKRGFRFLLGQGITIGSSRIADVVITQGRVGVLHARLLPNGESYAIVNANSVLGTAVNNKAVGRDPVAVKDGDRVRIGDMQLRFWTLKQLFARLAPPATR